MPENWTYLLLGTCFLVVLGLFYYYIHRQLQGIQTTQQSIRAHLLFQQKVLEKHDQLFSQTLGVPRSYPDIDTTSSALPPVISPPLSQPRETTSPTIDFPSSGSLGPMMGTILNMFQHIQPPTTSMEKEDEEEEMEEEMIPLTKEELQKELSKELEELQTSSPSPIADKKEGRVEEETVVVSENSKE